MTPILLRRAGKALYGDNWINPLARDLDVNANTVARWVSGYSRMPNALAGELRALLQARGSELRGVQVDLDGAINVPSRAATAHGTL